MMAKDSVKKRIESEVGLSYTEFAYQLMQGYDYYHLYTQKNCKLQMGGSDQWGNITTGTELIRRKVGGEAFAFTCPLITKADGTKFGKTEKGNVWLDLNLTSAYEFYQFWIRASDADAEKWIKIFTFLAKEEVDALLQQHSLDPGKSILQKKLAEEVTRFVHGEEELQKAQETTARLFANQNAPVESMSLADLQGLEGVTLKTFPASSLEQGVDAVSFLADSGSFASKGEARKTIQGGGVSINQKKKQKKNMKLRQNL